MEDDINKYFEDMGEIQNEESITPPDESNDDEELIDDNFEPFALEIINNFGQTSSWWWKQQREHSQKTQQADTSESDSDDDEDWGDYMDNNFWRPQDQLDINDLLESYI